MNFLIITHVPHIQEGKLYYAYAPYVREMNIWTKYIEELTIVAPINTSGKSAIDCQYKHPTIAFIPIDNFDLLSKQNGLKAIIKIPEIVKEIFKAMRQADHIHLRCPGNMGLIGCLVQILFPNKSKTAKYAGNWDPKSKQPWSYRLQKWILSNAFLTRNMQVLVYGEWKGNTPNIKPFFTATYKETDKKGFVSKDLKERIRFVFVGALTKGKNPLYAIQLVNSLSKRGYKVKLELFGEGAERKQLEHYILENQLASIIELKGNQSQDVLKEIYQRSHFVILPSKSEGWPKAIAEGMFWGCVPLATAVSCVPNMIDNGRRGILLAMDLEKDVSKIEWQLQNQADYHSKQEKATEWSRQYTLDVFEMEIKKLLKQ
jgi:glycosyltransferase involved in cell wall biosynthesis